MLIALDQAKIAFGSEEVPVGAVIIESQTGKIISKAHNKVEQLKDPTAHAEILAIRSAAYQIANARLTNVELFVTLEPCAMCAHAISLARIKKLVFGWFWESLGCLGVRKYQSFWFLNISKILNFLKKMVPGGPEARGPRRTGLGTLKTGLGILKMGWEY